MIRPRLRKVLMDVRSNRLRSLLVVASVTVGLFAVGVIATLHRVMTTDLTVGYARVDPPNIRISALPFDPDLVKGLKAVDGVRQVESGREFAARLQAAPGEWIAVDMHSLPADNTREIGRVEVVQGRYPPGPGEVVIEQYKLADTNAGVGDTITFEPPGGSPRPLRLVGVIADQTVGAFATGPGFFLAPVQAYVDRSTVERMQQPLPDRDNVIYLTVEGNADDETAIRETAERVRIKIEAARGQVISIGVRGSHDHPNRRYVEAISIVLLLLGLLVLFLSGFLITNTLQAIIQQQVTQIGILKTLGGRRIQVTALYIGLILIFGAAAGALAVPLAYSIAFSQIKPLAWTINMAYGGPRLLPEVLLLQIGMALLAPQLAAALPIWNGARISVHEALSGVRQSGGMRQTALDRLIRRARGFSRPTQLAIRNTFRRKGRLVLTLITLSLGGAIFIATFNVRVTMDSYVDLVSRYFLADVNLTLTDAARVAEIVSVLEQIPGVGAVEAWGSARTEMLRADGKSGEEVTLLAPPAASRLVSPQMIAGRWIIPEDDRAIALNERFQMDFPDLGVGDRLKLKINGRETEWTVVGFFQLAGRSSGFLAYTSAEALGRVTGETDRARVYRILGDGSGTQEALARAVEARLERGGVRIVDITTGSYLSSSSAQGFATLTGFLLFLAVLTALVGSIGLAGAMSLNILERTREIGILRAIGATDGHLRKLVLIEGLLTGGMSWILAAVASLPMSKLLSDSVSQAIFGNPSNLTLTPTGYLIWLGAALVLSAAASLLPARSAARLTIREVLAYE